MFLPTNSKITRSYIHKKLQRALARKSRANNPACFEEGRWEKKDKHWVREKGKNKKGVRYTTKSKRLIRAQHQLADLQRREAAFRKTQHGKMINDLLRIGKDIKTEKISYKSFQKCFGKSVGLRAPGMFVEKLRRKAENAGGRVEEFNTWSTALSQMCQCGQKEKKKLYKRWHKCSCGVEAQRDLYIAYLACFVENDKLMVDQANKSWSGMDIALHAAIELLKQTIRGPVPSSLGLSGS